MRTPCFNPKWFRSHRKMQLKMHQLPSDCRLFGFAFSSSLVLLDIVFVGVSQWHWFYHLYVDQWSLSDRKPTSILTTTNWRRQTSSQTSHFRFQQKRTNSLFFINIYSFSEHCGACTHMSDITLSCLASIILRRLLIHRWQKFSAIFRIITNIYQTVLCSMKASERRWLDWLFDRFSAYDRRHAFVPIAMINCCIN